MADTVLEVRDVEKRFGATLALDRVSLTLGEGEILALLGDNGAGKSTLIKILSGVVKPDAGEILIGGERVQIGSPHDARELGIETVYQDLALFDNFDAVGNFFAGREPREAGLARRARLGERPRDGARDRRAARPPPGQPRRATTRSA